MCDHNVGVLFCQREHGQTGVNKGRNVPMSGLFFDGSSGSGRKSYGQTRLDFLAFCRRGARLIPPSRCQWLSCLSLLEGEEEACARHGTQKKKRLIQNEYSFIKMSHAHTAYPYPHTHIHSHRESSCLCRAAAHRQAHAHTQCTAHKIMGNAYTLTHYTLHSHTHTRAHAWLHAYA